MGSLIHKCLGRYEAYKMEKHIEKTLESRDIILKNGNSILSYQSILLDLNFLSNEDWFKNLKIKYFNPDLFTTIYLDYQFDQVKQKKTQFDFSELIN